MPRYYSYKLEANRHEKGCFARWKICYRYIIFVNIIMILMRTKVEGHADKISG